MRAFPCCRSHSRCFATTGNRAVTTASRSLWKRGSFGCAEKSSATKETTISTPGGTTTTTVTKEVEKTGETEYTVPLASRQLVAVNKITMENPTHATVEYTWKWQPNRAGEFFDAGQPLVKGFETWDRTVLINKYGADFFHADPKSVVLKAAKTDEGWGVAPSE